MAKMLRRFQIPVMTAGLVLLLTACGGGGTPSAAALAAKIPGCTHITAGESGGGPAASDVTCTLPFKTLGIQDVAEIATFTSAGDERAWVASETSQEMPAAGSCCAVGAEGSYWAASESDAAGLYLQPIAKLVI